jgi:hypothetical protein
VWICLTLVLPMPVMPHVYMPMPVMCLQAQLRGQQQHACKPLHSPPPGNTLITAPRSRPSPPPPHPHPPTPHTHTCVHHLCVTRLLISSASRSQSALGAAKGLDTSAAPAWADLSAKGEPTWDEGGGRQKGGGLLAGEKAGLRAADMLLAQVVCSHMFSHLPDSVTMPSLC